MERSELEAIPEVTRKRIMAYREEQVKLVEPEEKAFSDHILHQPMEVLASACALMQAYKHKRNAELMKKPLEEFDPKNPAFVQLWGEDADTVQLVAYIGPTLVPYPLVMGRVAFIADYEKD